MIKRIVSGWRWNFPLAGFDGGHDDENEPENLACGMHQQDNLTFGRVGLKMFEDPGSRAAVIGFEFLGQLARHADTRRRVDVREDFQGGDKAVRGFEKDAGFA